MRDTKYMGTIEEYLIPSTPEIVRMYEENGGNLTRNADFGEDPLIRRNDLFDSRERLFLANSPSKQTVFSDVVHGDYQSLEKCLRLFYNLTLQLSTDELQ